MTKFEEDENSEDVDILRARDIKRVLDLSSNRVVLDVGANVGQFALSVLSEVDCLIHCFEPGKDAFVGLEELSRQERRIIPHKLGIDEISGFQNLFISESDVGSSLLEPVSGQQSLWATNIGTELVQTKRIDELIEDLALSNIALLKTDAQGADYRVLKSAGKYLSPEYIGSILVELNLHKFYEGQDSLSSIIELMEESGYFLAGFYPHQNKNNWLWWADGLFLPLSQPYTT